jgi:hypothetical protein
MCYLRWETWHRQNFLRVLWFPLVNIPFTNTSLSFFHNPEDGRSLLEAAVIQRINRKSCSHVVQAGYKFEYKLKNNKWSKKHVNAIWAKSRSFGLLVKIVTIIKKKTQHTSAIALNNCRVLSEAQKTDCSTVTHKREMNDFYCHLPVIFVGF